jgi:hypothetical protein
VQSPAVFPKASSQCLRKVRLLCLHHPVRNVPCFQHCSYLPHLGAAAAAGAQGEQGHIVMQTLRYASVKLCPLLLRDLVDRFCL